MGRPEGYAMTPLEIAHKRFLECAKSTNEKRAQYLRSLEAESKAARALSRLLAEHLTTPRTR